MKQRLLFLISLVITVTMFTSCENFPDTPEVQTTPEPIEQATPEPTTQQSPDTKEKTLSVAEAQDLIIGIYENYKITYIPEMNKQEGGVSYYSFKVDYTENISETSTYTYCYAWVNSVTGYVEFEEAGYTEANGRSLYANIPDNIFPIPMRGSTIIPYDRFSPPEYVRSVTYSYKDKSVMQSYQAQLRTMGFVDNGHVQSVDSLWTYERDGATFMVEMFVEEEMFSMSMVNF